MYVVGPPLAVAVCAPVSVHEIEYQAPVTFTGSLNVIETFELPGTSLALFAGVVEATTAPRRRAGPVPCEPRPSKVSFA